MSDPARTGILNVALIQMHVELGNPGRNLDHVRSAIRQACSEKAQLVCLPELWLTGFDLDRRARWAELFEKEVRDEISQLAKDLGVYLHAGSFLTSRNDNCYNTSFFFNTQGACVDTYDKIHLFRFMGEKNCLTRGTQPGYNSLFGGVGQSICYDLRFPELYRYYALQGARMVFVPAQWPRPRRHHWRTLLRARAIEDQFFVLGTNRVGVSGDLSFFGASAIVGPDGSTLAEGGQDEEIVLAQIDLSEVEDIRSEFPVLEDAEPLE